MFPSSAARNYARGLLAVASASATPQALATGLADFVRLLGENRELAGALKNSAIPVSRRAEIARAVLAAGGASPLLQGFLARVVENGHVAGLPAISTALDRAVAEASGVMVAAVRTAHPARPEDLEQLGLALGKLLGRKIEIEASVDPSLLGGFVARAGDLVYDGSIARQLQKLRGELTRS